MGETPLRVAMLLAKEVAHDTRVRKEAEAVAAAGHEVRVFSVAADVAVEVRGGVTYETFVFRRTTRELWQAHRSRQTARAERLAPLLRARPARLAYLAKNAAERGLYVRARAAARHLELERSVRGPLEAYAPGVVHAHDLATLHAATRYARRQGVPLIYDSHELELYSRRRRAGYERTVARVVERRGIRTAQAVITVSHEIADALARMYRGVRPAVVLNSPRRGAASEPAPLSLREACGLGAEEALVVYTGLLVAGRGLAQTVSGLALLPERVHLAVLGPREPAPERVFLEHVRTLGVEHRVHLVDPVPGHLVPSVVATADATVIPLEDVCLSYNLTLPNKLFDAVMAGVPIAASSVRATSEFVRRHALGAVFEVERPESVAAALAEVLARVPPGIADRDRLSALQDEVAWERQEVVLREVYARVAALTSRATTGV